MEESAEQRNQLGLDTSLRSQSRAACTGNRRGICSTGTLPDCLSAKR